MKFVIDHDLHCHTHLSLCSGDPSMTPQAIAEHAEREGYRTVCITDHYWDESLPDIDPWYQQQNTPHVMEDYPFQLHIGESETTPNILLGCETEFLEDGRVGISPEKYDLFSFIIIPPNHLHLKEITCPSAERTVEGLSEVFTDRLDRISKLSLPWHKVGIAHLNWLYEGELSRQVLDHMDSDRLTEIFRRFARNGAGIELNSNCFLKEFQWPEKKESHLKLLKLARDAGCKFYCGSDAHTVADLNAPEYNLRRCLEPVVTMLELREEDTITLPK